MVFMVKPEKTSQGPVLLTMNCESCSDEKGSCRGTIDLADVIDKLPLGEWSPISINLDCFTQQGVKFDKIVVPFELVSAKPMALSLSDIVFVAYQADTAMVQCQ